MSPRRQIRRFRSGNPAGRERRRTRAGRLAGFAACIPPSREPHSAAFPTGAHVALDRPTQVRPRSRPGAAPRRHPRQIAAELGGEGPLASLAPDSEAPARKDSGQSPDSSVHGYPVRGRSLPKVCVPARPTCAGGAWANSASWNGRSTPPWTLWCRACPGRPIPAGNTSAMSPPGTRRRAGAGERGSLRAGEHPGCAGDRQLRPGGLVASTTLPHPAAAARNRATGCAELRILIR